MSTEKRLVFFLVLSLGVLFGSRLVMEELGLVRRPVPAAAPKAAAKGEPKAEPTRPVAKAAEPAKQPPGIAAQPKPEQPGPATPPEVALAKPDELVLGSAADTAANGFRLELTVDQRGAGVARLRSSRWEAERVPGQPRGRPLNLILPEDSKLLPGPDSFTLDIDRPSPEDDPAAGDDLAATPNPTPLLAKRLWEVVRDDQGRAVRPINRTDPRSKARSEGQELVLRATVGDPKVVVTRTYRLWKGEDGFELDLDFASATDQTLTYQLLGPHRMPIEGDWYTSTFRDVFFGGYNGSTTQVLTLAAYTVARNPDEPERYTSLPIRFAGAENQYFAIFLQPLPPAETRAESWIDEGRAVAITTPADTQRADVSVELLSKPFEIGPNREVRHTFRVYAGPKTKAALEPFAATELSAYRKGWSLWVVGDLGAGFMAQRVIAPLLERIYAVTTAIAQAFGFKQGNFGLAIILLTITVRLILFPLSRKAARTAQKMQQLQPLMAELKTKYEDDKERLTKETFALYRQYGVNPMGGCLPALVQLPVLIGLWQALNNSVALRHSSFLWMENLAAPDMLFRFPFEIPLVGRWLGPYFNLLPLVVVSLMLVQTKLFSPPPTTPEAEAQQKMMKYMMVFMMFMFYKVPAGLGIYFITSSLWQIGERLLLPKPTLTAVATPGSGEDARPGKGGWLSDVRQRAQARIGQIMDEAAKDPTHRNANPPPGERRDRDRNRPRPGPGNGPGPGRKR